MLIYVHVDIPWNANLTSYRFGSQIGLIVPFPLIIIIASNVNFW